MSIYKHLSHISHKKDNKAMILKYLQNHSNDESTDLIYEMAYEIKENKKDLKDVFNYLKNSKLGLDHPDFLEVSKKIEETDTFMNKPFDVEEGTVDCKRCKSKRTMTYGKQLRGADESTSVITYCVECKYRSISH